MASAFANGACTDLDTKRKAATEVRLNRKIHKINAIKSNTLRRLLGEKETACCLTVPFTVTFLVRSPGVG